MFSLKGVLLLVGNLSKESIRAYMDDLTDAARTIGAVNTASRIRDESITFCLTSCLADVSAACFSKVTKYGERLKGDNTADPLS